MGFTVGDNCNGTNGVLKDCMQPNTVHEFRFYLAVFVTRQLLKFLSRLANKITNDI